MLDPNKLSTEKKIWSKLPAEAIIPPPRDIFESAQMQEAVSEVLSQAFFSGRVVPDQETETLRVLFDNDALVKLGYRQLTKLEMADAASKATKLHDSRSASLLARLGLAVIYECRCPGTVDWAECRQEFESLWSDIKKDLVGDVPATRAAARQLAEYVKNPIRLPNGSQGSFRIAPDRLLKDIEKLIFWSRERDGLNP